MTTRSALPVDSAAGAPTVVAARGVCKAYGAKGQNAPVLAGVDLTVARGQCVFLAGPSGSGKSTLLSIFGCVLSFDSGSVHVLGEDLAALSPQQLVTMRRDRLGFVFQRFHLIRGLNALENVCVPLTLRGVDETKACRRGLEMLEAVGLAEKAKTHPGQLSAGQCQRIALARALVGNPELVLADEPTASLDARNGQEVMALLLRLVKAENKTAIVVTHDQRIFRFADHIYWLENGRVVQQFRDDEHLIAPTTGSAGVAAGSELLNAATEWVAALT